MTDTERDKETKVTDMTPTIPLAAAETALRNLPAITLTEAFISRPAALDALRGVVVGASDACKNCAGEGWVCENHRDRPWSGDGCECGAGAPCPICQWEHATAGTIGSAVWPDELRAEADRRQKRGQDDD